MLGRGGFRDLSKGDYADPFFLRLGTTDWLVLEEIYFLGEYDALSQINLGEVRQIVDLRANIDFPPGFGDKNIPGADVLAVEPDWDNILALKRNCQTDERTRIVQACVAGSERTVRIDRSAGAWGVRMVDGGVDQNSVAVKALPLTSILADEHVSGDIDLLKCDIEGAEAEVFANCADWIGRVRVIILEIHAPYTLNQWQEDIRIGGGHLNIIRTIKSSPEATVILAGVPSLVQPVAN